MNEEIRERIDRTSNEIHARYGPRGFLQSPVEDQLKLLGLFGDSLEVLIKRRASYIWSLN
jgi:hypothetical protein